MLPEVVRRRRYRVERQRRKELPRISSCGKVLLRRAQKMGVSSAPECDWDESPQKRLRETLAFADNLMTKNMLRQLLNVEE